jgi:hypothetical protein
VFTYNTYVRNGSAINIRKRFWNQFQLQFHIQKPFVGKGKGKVIPVLFIEHDAIIACWGSGGMAPLIL